jgi:hypothetical protein
VRHAPRCLLSRDLVGWKWGLLHADPPHLLQDSKTSIVRLRTCPTKALAFISGYGVPHSSEAASVQGLWALDGQAQEKQEMDSLSGVLLRFMLRYSLGYSFGLCSLGTQHEIKYNFT